MGPKDKKNCNDNQSRIATVEGLTAVASVSRTGGSACSGRTELAEVGKAQSSQARDRGGERAWETVFLGGCVASVARTRSTSENWVASVSDRLSVASPRPRPGEESSSNSRRSHGSSNSSWRGRRRRKPAAPEPSRSRGTGEDPARPTARSQGGRISQCIAGAAGEAVYPPRRRRRRRPTPAQRTPTLLTSVETPRDFAGD